MHHYVTCNSWKDCKNKLCHVCPTYFVMSLSQLHHALMDCINDWWFTKNDWWNLEKYPVDLHLKTNDAAKTANAWQIVLILIVTYLYVSFYTLKLTFRPVNWRLMENKNLTSISNSTVNYDAPCFLYRNSLMIWVLFFPLYIPLYSIRRAMDMIQNLSFVNYLDETY